jgi:hypothetical protein
MAAGTIFSLPMFFLATRITKPLIPHPGIFELPDAKTRHQNQNPAAIRSLINTADMWNYKNTHSTTSTFFFLLALPAVLMSALLQGCQGEPGADNPLLKPYLAGNEKVGRVYYQQVCSSCHRRQLNQPISPADRTQQVWQDYFTRNRHAAQPQQPLDQFFSADFRQEKAEEI